MDSTDTRTQEEHYLARVIAAIDGEIVGRGGNIEQALKELRTVDVTDFNARNRMLSQSNTGEKRMRRLAEQRLNPYFGRVDFDDHKENVKERIYLGPSHIRHKSVDYVHDWRAPVGELFYQTYGGHTTYRAPSGIIPVTIHLKRRFTIKESSLVDIADTFDGSDPDPSIADSLLADMLKRSAGTNMGQIVRSIQAEQDRVIRAGGDIVIVQGPAGSGKTVVALHRAAYLLYRMRQTADAQQYALISASSMRVFSPNRVFAEYISHVLPDLQEDAIDQSVFEQFLLNELIGRLRADKALAKTTVQRKEERFEAMLAATGDDYDRMVAICRAKTAASIAGELRAFLTSEEAALRESVAAAIADAFTGRKPVLTPADILARFDRAASRHGDSVSLVERLQDVIAFLKEEIAERQTQLRAAKKPPARNAVQAFRLSPAQQDVLAAQIETLSGLSKTLTQKEREIEKRPLLALYTAFWEQREGTDWIRESTLAALAKRHIAYEDIPAMLCLNGFYRGFPKLRGTIHAIVDECQDYTPLHYEFLKQCLPDGCMMTVVGDLNQTVDETVSLGGYEALAEVFPGRTSRLDLTRSYRSSQEITAFASAVLGAGASIDNVRRSGRQPELVSLTDAADAPAAIAGIVSRMRAGDYRQIAVVCKSRLDAHRAHAALPAELGASLMTEDADHIPTGVIVVPIAQAKGLEFDAVIVHDAGEHAFSRPADRRLLYTACTRALHELVLIHSGPVSRLLPTDETLFSRAE